MILLDIKDVSELTGWCEAVTRKTFKYNDKFPAIKIGKSYQVELNALLDFLKNRCVEGE